MEAATGGILGRYGLRDRSLLAWTVLWSAAALLAVGLVTAIIPNPIFGRGIPPGPANVATWLVSAPLMGFVMATYFARPPAVAVPLTLRATAEAGSGGGTTLGTIGGLAAFLAIGCPTCNKIALLLLGTSGAVTVFQPIQPLIGAVSLVLLAITAAWRLRLRARGGACEVRA